MDPIIIEAQQSGDPDVLDLAAEIWKLDTAHQEHRQQLLWNLATATNKAKHPPLDLSDIITIVDVAPDEESQLEAVMVRLAKRGEYDPLAVELAIATVGPHDTDAIVSLLESLAITKIEHSTTASGRNLVHCVACEEQLPVRDLILASCGHCYCGSCISIMFNAAILDESCYPPKCCANIPIPIEHAKRFLDPEFGSLFEAKGVEFDTVKRTYCSDPQCSKFIPPSYYQGDTTLCSSCWQRTCVVCKAPAHDGDCPADLELAALVKLAEEMQWQRCYGCLSIVQRHDGCNIMECRCGAYFCYICGRVMRDEEACPCFEDDPPVYRMHQPSGSPELHGSSDDVPPPTEFSDGDGEMFWIGVPHVVARAPPADHGWDHPDAHWAAATVANHEEAEPEHQRDVWDEEERWTEWMPADIPQVIGGDDDEAYPVDGPSSILERLADFLNF